MERYSGRVLSRYYHQEVYIHEKRKGKYQDAVKSFDKANQYDVAEAISLVKKKRYSEV